MQRGNRHTACHGLIENDQCSGSGPTERRWCWPEITNGAGNVSHPEVFCSARKRTVRLTDWAVESQRISSFSDTCVSVRSAAVDRDLIKPAVRQVLPRAMITERLATGGLENLGKRRKAGNNRAATDGPVCGGILCFKNRKVNRQNNDVEVQIIAFRARKIGSKAEALQGEPW